MEHLVSIVLINIIEFEFYCMCLNPKINLLLSKIY